MRTSRRQFLAAAAAASVARPALALSGADAESFVRSLVDDVLKIINNASAGDPRLDDFHALLNRAADVDAVARFVSGLAWRQMSGDQRARFLTAFRDYAARIYAANLSKYSGQTVEVTGMRDLGRRGVLVESQFRQSGQKPLPVGWLVSDRGGAIKLVDVIAADVSVSVTTRERFSAMLAKRNGDIDAFISDIESLQP